MQELSEGNCCNQTNYRKNGLEKPREGGAEVRRRRSLPGDHGLGSGANLGEKNWENNEEGGGDVEGANGFH